MASTSTLATTDDGEVVVGLVAWWYRLFLGAACQLWRLLDVRLVALFALGNLEIAFVFGCCLWSTSFWCRVRCLVQQWIHSSGGFGRIQHFLRSGELES